MENSVKIKKRFLTRNSISKAMLKNNAKNDI